MYYYYYYYNLLFNMTWTLSGHLVMQYQSAFHCKWWKEPNVFRWVGCVPVSQAVDLGSIPMVVMTFFSSNLYHLLRSFSTCYFNMCRPNPTFCFSLVFTFIFWWILKSISFFWQPSINLRWHELCLLICDDLLVIQYEAMLNSIS